MSKIASTKKLSLERELIVSGKPEDMYTFQKRLSKELSEMYEILAQASNNLRTEFDALHTEFDALQVTWTDYSATSTVVGWASFTKKVIQYRVIGSVVFVYFNLVGTSNATTITFTLPYAASTAADVVSFCRSSDRGGASITGLTYIVAEASLVTCFHNVTGGGASYTNSGTKYVEGYIVYAK